jgi:trehalose-6-phosphatase
MLGAGWVWMAMLVKSFLNFVSKYKLVIFDFDGTLKDCAKIKTNAINTDL